MAAPCTRATSRDGDRAGVMHRWAGIGRPGHQSRDTIRKDTARETGLTGDHLACIPAVEAGPSDQTGAPGGLPPVGLISKRVRPLAWGTAHQGDFPLADGDDRDPRTASEACPPQAVAQLRGTIGSYAWDAGARADHRRRRPLRRRAEPPSPGVRSSTVSVD